MSQFIQRTSFNSYQPIKGLAPLVMNFLVPVNEFFVNKRESVACELATRRSNTEDVTIPKTDRDTVCIYPLF